MATEESSLTQVRDFERFVLTDKGVTLLSKLQTGSVLEVTRVSVGDGEINFEDVNINELNDLIHYTCDTTVVQNKNNSNGTSTLTAELTNEGREQAVFISEIGIFVRDPHEGEILYAYSFVKVPTCLPIYSGYEIATIKWDLITSIGNADNVKVEIKKIVVDYDEFHNYLGNFQSNFNTQVEAINRNFSTVNNDLKGFFEQYEERYTNQLEDVVSSIENRLRVQLEEADALKRNLEQILGNSDLLREMNEIKLVNERLRKNDETFAIEIAFLTDKVPYGYKNMLVENFVDLLDFDIDGDISFIGYEEELFTENFSNLANFKFEGDVTTIGYEGKAFSENFVDISKIKLASGVYDSQAKRIYI